MICIYIERERGRERDTCMYLVPVIHNMLTTIGHRLRHQSDLDESTAQNSTSSLYGAAFRVHLVFSQINKNITY